MEQSQVFHLKNSQNGMLDILLTKQRPALNWLTTLALKNISPQVYTKPTPMASCPTLSWHKGNPHLHNKYEKSKKWLQKGDRKSDRNKRDQDCKQLILIR